MSNLPYIVITGPTAVGKSKTALCLAEIIGGEIISADSMQVYKYMDVGTAKVSEEDMRRVPHYLINLLEPREEYSAYIFKQKAESCAEFIRNKGKFPIVCGGTGFYINSLVNDSGFSETVTDTAYRERLYSFGAEALHEILSEIDPESAEAIHPNNVKRVVRAIEYFHQTGQKISSHNLQEKQKSSSNAFIAVLTMDRNRLYKKINSRVDEMLKNGLLGEVKSLLDMGLDRRLVSMQGIGYKEMASHIQGEITLESAVEAIKTGSRRYAKRQLTWFKHQCTGHWYDIEDYVGHAQLAQKIAKDFEVYNGKNN